LDRRTQVTLFNSLKRRRNPAHGSNKVIDTSLKGGELASVADLPDISLRPVSNVPSIALATLAFAAFSHVLRSVGETFIDHAGKTRA
jgi:hypothetical protein